jgi:hypothetical protein
MGSNGKPYNQTGRSRLAIVELNYHILDCCLSDLATEAKIKMCDSKDGDKLAPQRIHASATRAGAKSKQERQQHREPPKSFPLGMVLQACQKITDYGPGGSVSSWRDLMTAAVVVRSMLGVSPSAYEEACGTLGPENVATIVACILERGGHINSAGGYLRDLTRRAERGEFSIGPMLMALMRANSSALRAG